MGEQQYELPPAKLSLRTRLAYAFPRGATVGMTLMVTNMVRPYYVDELGMEVARQAMLVAICKSVDFLIGFAVGYTSDHMSNHTVFGRQFGRRSIYIIIGFPVWLFCFYFLANPDWFKVPGDESWAITKTPANPAAAECEALVDDTVYKDCNALQECLTNLITNGTLAGYREDQIDEEEVYAGTKLSIYFCVLYFIYYSIGFSFTIIPYDALGMELTEDYDERAILFGYKGCFQFLGYLLFGLLLMGMSTMYPESIPTQINIISFIFVLLVASSFLFLFNSIRERELPPREDKPLVPSILAVFKNGPYLIYLLMKIPLSVAGQMPITLSTYFVKLVLQEENSSFWIGAVIVTILISSVIGTPLLVKLQTMFDKKTVLVWLTGLGGTFMVSAYFIPEFSAGLMCACCVPIGVILAGTQIIPDALLGDIIDYDELHTGERNEGVYTIVETNLQQWIEIPAGVVPLMWLGWVGYETNAGCSCGCGVQCPSSFLRWNCTEHPDGDTGYACNDKIGDPFGMTGTGSMLLPISADGTYTASAEDRIAPCTDQNDDVKEVLKFCMFMIPGLFLLLGVIPTYLAPITREKHHDILDQIKKRHMEGRKIQLTDPLTSRPIIATDTEKDPKFLLASFTRAELRVAANSGMGAVITRLWIQMFMLLVIFFAIIAGIIMQPNSDVVTFASLAMAFMMMLIPWQMAKIRLFRSLTDVDKETVFNPVSIGMHLSATGSKADMEEMQLSWRQKGFRPEPEGDVPATPTS